MSSGLILFQDAGYDCIIGILATKHRILWIFVMDMREIRRINQMKDTEHDGLQFATESTGQKRSRSVGAERANKSSPW